MPLQRDEHEFESKRQQIIDGALEVFATKGFEKATNKDIAEAAGGISAGLIYHYFKDKADLFRHVVEQRTQVLMLFAHGEEIMDLPPHEALTRFGMAFAQTVNNRAATKMVKLMIGEAARRPMVADMVNTIGPGRIFALLRRYLERQMEAGMMRRMDVGAAVRCFVGPLLAFALTRELFPQPDTQTLSAETMVQTAIDIFLQGMLVHPPANDASV